MSKKFTDLAELTSAASDDVLAIVDSSANTSKKITVENLLGRLYPVGSLYFNGDVSTNPATLLGFGTWERYAEGRAIIGVDESDEDFETPGLESGSKTHVHSLYQADGATGFAMVAVAASAGYGVQINRLTSPSWTRTHKAGTETAVGGDGATTQGTGLGGDTAAGNSLQPGIAVYVWKRTA